MLSVKEKMVRKFFLENTPEAFKARILKQAKGDVVLAKILEEKFHYDIRHCGEN